MYEVNRSLFLLIPREPFWHWLHSIGTDLSDFTLEDLQDDANAYLTDPGNNTDEIWDSIEGRVEEIFAAELADLQQLAQLGLLKISDSRIEVSAKGRFLIRNIAMVFDRYLRHSETRTKYSQTV